MGNFVLDDRVIIPEWIKKLTPEERRAEIRRLEKEEADKYKLSMQSLKHPLKN